MTTNIPQKLYLAASKLRNRFLMGAGDFPTAIGIETAQACNRRCNYCLQSISPRKQRLMDDELYGICLMRLREINWRGNVSIVAYNEPGIQSNFIQRITALRAAVPKACIVIPTNGDYPDKIEQWIDAGVDRVTVTKHQPSSDDWDRDINYLMRRHPVKVGLRILKPKDLHDNAHRVEVGIGAQTECTRYSSGLMVNINGIACLCCLNYYDDELGMGDVRTTSLLDLWRSDEWTKARQLLAQGIPVKPICKQCLRK